MPPVERAGSCISELPTPTSGMTPVSVLGRGGGAFFCRQQQAVFQYFVPVLFCFAQESSNFCAEQQNNITVAANKRILFRRRPVLYRRCPVRRGATPSVLLHMKRCRRLWRRALITRTPSFGAIRTCRACSEWGATSSPSLFSHAPLVICDTSMMSRLQFFWPTPSG